MACVSDLVLSVFPPSLRAGMWIFGDVPGCKILPHQYSPLSTPARLYLCFHGGCHALLPTIVRFVLAKAYSLHTCPARFSRGTLLAHLDALPELSLSTAWVLFPVAGFESTRPPPFVRLSAIWVECASSSTHIHSWMRIIT